MNNATTPLPVIRPRLGDIITSDWTDETQKKCGCDLCTRWGPLTARIEYQLDKNGKELLNELINEWMHNREDLDVANAKLDGNWPGWEDMKNFKPKDTQ